MTNALVNKVIINKITKIRYKMKKKMEYVPLFKMVHIPFFFFFFFLNEKQNQQ